MHFKLLVKDGMLEEAIMCLRAWEANICASYARGHHATKDDDKKLHGRVHKLFSPLEEDVICKRTDSNSMLIDFAHLNRIQLRGPVSEPLWHGHAAFQRLPRRPITGPSSRYHFMPGKLRRRSPAGLVSLLKGWPVPWPPFSFFPSGLTVLTGNCLQQSLVRVFAELHSSSQTINRRG